MDLASEFPGLLRIIFSTYTRTVSEDEYLELRQQIRVAFWIGALQLAGIKQGKCFPTQEQRASDQRALRTAFLGERPQEQCVTELDRLVQQEIELDDLYQALQWHAEQGYLGETTEFSPEGYDFGGPGLLWESLTDHFVFGDEGEPDLEDLREYREAMLGLAGVSELKPDLDHLLRKEQHLERAYRKLLEHVQQHARESAVENLKITVPKPEVLTTGESSANLCPALIASSGFHGQEMNNLMSLQLKIFQDLCPTLLAIPETGDLIDVSVEEESPSKPPAEVLATRQRVQDLCPTPVAVLEAQGEKVAITSQQQIQGEKGEEVSVVPSQQLARVEEAAFPPQQRSVHLGDSTIDMSCQQPDEGMEKEAAGSPSQWQLHCLGVEESSLLPQWLAGAEFVKSQTEVLATRQSTTNLCPSLATTTEFQGGGTVGLPPQQLAGADGVGFPAEGLATGLSTAGLCPQLTEDGFPVKVDGTSVSTCIPQGCWAVSSDLQQHDGVSLVTLSSLQRQKGHQGEGPVQASLQQQICSLREEEVGW
ncbi:hypothetical protein AB205_0181460, partial [Aquarana catesbeiana]